MQLEMDALSSCILPNKFEHSETWTEQWIKIDTMLTFAETLFKNKNISHYIGPKIRDIQRHKIWQYPFKKIATTQ